MLVVVPLVVLVVDPVVVLVVLPLVVLVVDPVVVLVVLPLVVPEVVPVVLVVVPVVGIRISRQPPTVMVKEPEAVTPPVALYV